MSDIVQTLTLRGLSGDALDAAMVESLTSRGYRVIPPAPDRVVGPWEKPSRLAARLGLHPGSVSRIMARPGCPEPTAVNRGHFTGRVVSLISNPALDAFLTANKRGGAA